MRESLGLWEKGRTVSESFGQTLVLNHLAQELGLSHCLKEAFPGDQESLLKLAFEVAREGQQLSSLKIGESYKFAQIENKTKDKKTTSSQLINEDKKLQFLQDWLNQNGLGRAPGPAKDNGLFFDLIALKSYGPYLLPGDPWDKDERLPRLQLGAYFDQSHALVGLPRNYQVYQGQGNDKSDLRLMVNQAKSWGLKDTLFVLDRYFDKNIDYNRYLKYGYNFIMPFSESKVFYGNILAKYSYLIKNPDNKIKSHKVFAQSFEQEICGLELKVHVIYDPQLAKKEADNLHYCINNHIKIVNMSTYFGYFVIISTDKSLSSSFILDLLAQRNAIEYEFNTLISFENFESIKTLYKDVVNNNIFIQFLSFILKCYIERKIRLSNNKKLQKLSAKEILARLKQEDSHNVATGKAKKELSEPQKEIFEALGVPIT